MKNGKVPITEDNYKRIVLRRAIILCWVLLAVCFVIKLFGGNFFAIMCENEKYIAFCEWVDNTPIHWAIYYLFFFIETTILLNTISVYNKKMYFICIGLATLYWVIYIGLTHINVLNNVFVENIISMVMLYAICCLYSKNFIKPIIGIALLNLYTIISMVTKNLSLESEITNSTVNTYIFMIDYYMLLILTMLYSKSIFNKKKEGV